MKINAQATCIRKLRCVADYDSSVSLHRARACVRSVKVSAFNNEIAPFFALSLSLYEISNEIEIGRFLFNYFRFFIEFKLNTK